MSTGTDTETKLAVEQEQNKIKLPIIDFKNEWLNKDKELYTLIFTKTALGISISGVNVALGSDTLERATIRSLSTIVSGLFEVGCVSLNRALISNTTDKKSQTAIAGFIFTDIVLGLVYVASDVIGNVYIVGYNLPEIQVQPLIAIPPALMNLAFPQQELPRSFSPNLQTIQNGLNILNGITLIGGSIGVFAGIIASQFA